MKSRGGILRRQSQNGSPAADFNIVGMTTQTEHRQPGMTAPVERKRNHAPVATSARPSGATSLSVASPLFHTFHGATLREFISSNRCLSLKVSMHCQKPVYL